jgi:plastocyanin
VVNSRTRQILLIAFSLRPTQQSGAAAIPESPQLLSDQGNARNSVRSGLASTARELTLRLTLFNYQPGGKMAKTSRRDLLKVAGAGGVAAGLGMTTKAERRREPGSKQHNHKPISGPNASATVSFGQWQTGPAAFDRAGAGDPNDRFRNQHQLIPNEVTIKAGGSVNFIVAGFHQIAIYGNGKKPEDVSVAVIVPPIPPGLIDDPVNRVFRGVNPTTVPQDRVEVVHFAEPGLYLVICAVLPHFNDKMYGWVKVNP